MDGLAEKLQQALTAQKAAAPSPKKARHAAEQAPEHPAARPLPLLQQKTEIQSAISDPGYDAFVEHVSLQVASQFIATSCVCAAIHMLMF